MKKIPECFKRTQFLNLFFASRLDLFASRDSASSALRLLMSPGRRMTVSDVARQAGLSARQLERHALQRAGMSPQMMMRISRFQRAMRLKLEGTPNWTEVAYAADYQDQMHMIRDFHAFAGDSPVRMLKQSAPNHLGRLGLLSHRMAHDPGLNVSLRATELFGEITAAL